METPGSKAIDRIERAMEGARTDPMRYEALQSARKFKSTWIELGRTLYSVWKDGLFKRWGFLTFEAYIAGEIGIRKQTALKLLRSYRFLETATPQALREDYMAPAGSAPVPAYESVDLLRAAEKKRGLDADALAALRRDVIEKGKDPGEMKRELASLIREREELAPEEARRRKRVAAVRKLLGALRSVHREVSALKLLPAPLLAETDDLIRKLTDAIS